MRARAKGRRRGGKKEWLRRAQEKAFPPDPPTLVSGRAAFNRSPQTTSVSSCLSIAGLPADSEGVSKGEVPSPLVVAPLCLLLPRGSRACLLPFLLPPGALGPPAKPGAVAAPKWLDRYFTKMGQNPDLLRPKRSKTAVLGLFGSFGAPKPPKRPKNVLCVHLFFWDLESCAPPKVNFCRYLSSTFSDLESHKNSN